MFIFSNKTKVMLIALLKEQSSKVEDYLVSTVIREMMKVSSIVVQPRVILTY